MSTANMLQYVKKYPDAYQMMAEVMDDVVGHSYEQAVEKWGAFIVDVSRKCYNAPVTEKQATALVKAVLQKKQFDQAREDEAVLLTSPVIEGRITITGEVVVLKIQETQYGDTLKMRVLDDRGFALWGTVPKALRQHTLLKGDRVEFEASVKKSRDQETFGFFGNPRGGKLVSRAEKAPLP